MKTLLTCLLLSSSVAILVGEVVLRLAFPPFTNEDMKSPVHSLPDRPSYEERKAISVEEWRSIMATTGIPDQLTAAKELIERGDQKTILRLVYSFKQGNVAAEQLLGQPNSLAAIPYLMEDVAHGSLDYYGIFSKGDGVFGEGRVRVAAVKVVTSLLVNAPEFTGETKDCLRAISSGREYRIQGLSDQSRYLIEWWLLNETAFAAGKWEDILPLPYEITYLHSKDDPYFLNEELETQPPYGSPMWELAEPFEEWSERIVDPHRRNLDFVALSWDGKRVIEHPAKSLDPRGRPLSVKDREARRSPAQMSLPESESGDRVKGIAWITGVGVLIVVLAILWWMRRRFAAEV